MVFVIEKQIQSFLNLVKNSVKWVLMERHIGIVSHMWENPLQRFDLSFQLWNAEWGETASLMVFILPY